VDDRKHDSEFILIVALVLGALSGSAWLFFGQGRGSSASTPDSKTMTVTIDGAAYVCKPAPPNPSVE
jgi:hypothetical protein